MNILEVVPFSIWSTPFQCEMLVLDGQGLILEDGRSIKFKDIAEVGADGGYIFPPRNANGNYLPYVMRWYLLHGKERKYEEVYIVTPSEVKQRYMTWLNKAFSFSIRDILRFLCAYEDAKIRERYLGRPHIIEFDACCRDCIYSVAVDGHVSTASCKNGSKSGKFKAGEDVCRFFKEEMLRDGVPAWKTKTQKIA